MRDDLIKIIGRQKDLTHVFIVTFNIDFIFIESVLLRELRKCGHPTLTVLADAGEIVSTFESQGRWVSRVGRRYRAVPISMERGFRFHPKAVMLSGPEHADLFVGSGNLNFGGMRQNDEIWIRYNSTEDGTGPLAAFRAFAERCLQRAARAGAARHELHDAFDPDQHPWAASLEGPTGLLSRVGAGPSLIDLMAGAIGDLDIERIVVGSPYFDDAGDALAALADRWSGVPIELLIQQEHSQLSRSAWSRIRDPKSIRSVSTGRGQDSRAFIHAKFYGFVGASETLVFAGSANCSRAALTIPGSGGNAELLAVMRIPSEQFDDVILSALTMSEDPPELRTKPLPPGEEPFVPPLRIQAAHYEHGLLIVDFTAPNGLRKVELLADGRMIVSDELQLSRGVLKAHGTGAVSRVQVAGDVDGERCVSAEHWVDHEFALGATSHQRRMAQAIGEHVAPGQWSFQGWGEILRLLGDHLRYAPKDAGEYSERKKAEKSQAESFDSAAFYTDDYRLPRQRREPGPIDDVTRVLGLRRLLLDYFGIDYEDDEVSDTDEEGVEDEDTVDRQADVRKRPADDARKRPKRDITDAERRRTTRLARQIIDTCASKQFIAARPASMLSFDLAVLAVMLVSGHAKRWLSDEDFLDLTHRAWTFLFFDDGTDEHGRDFGAGALDRRHRASGDQRAFVESVRSARLAASLATWCFCCPEDVSHAEAARFQVATRLAVARLPWLWKLDDRAAVEQELYELARRTGWLGPDVSARWGEVVAEWDRLFSEGLALARLERVLMEQELADLRESVADDAIPAGTLLWQGPKLGFCILTQAANRGLRFRQAVPVLTLRPTGQDTRLLPSYLLPFRRLVKLASKRSPERVGPSHVEALLGFADRLESKMARHR